MKKGFVVILAGFFLLISIVAVGHADPVDGLPGFLQSAGQPSHQNTHAWWSGGYRCHSPDQASELLRLDLLVSE